jgi:hypothetical protein
VGVGAAFIYNYTNTNRKRFEDEMVDIITGKTTIPEQGYINTTMLVNDPLNQEIYGKDHKEWQGNNGADQYLIVRNILFDAGYSNEELDAYKYPSSAHFNLCGLISISAATGIPLPEVVKAFDQGVDGGRNTLLNKDSDVTLEQLIQLSKQCGYDATNYNAADADGYLNTNGGKRWDTAYPELGYPDPAELANLLNKGDSIIALVGLNRADHTADPNIPGDVSYPSGLLGRNQYINWGKTVAEPTPHYVTIVAIFKQGNTQMVRIYNPYYSREETYQWVTFVKDWASGASGQNSYSAIVLSPKTPPSKLPAPQADQSFDYSKEVANRVIAQVTPPAKPQVSPAAKSFDYSREMAKSNSVVIAKQFDYSQQMANRIMQQTKPK